MFLTKNSLNAISILYTGSHKSFLILMGKCLKCILTYLYYINYDEIFICISDIEKHSSLKNCINATNILYTGSLKTFLILMGEMFKVYILTYLYCTKYNEMNIRHSDVQSMFRM